MTFEFDRQNRSNFQQLESIFSLGQKYAQAGSEQEIVNLLLQNAVEIVGGCGASFVPLDEHKQPRAAIRYGDLPDAVLDPWLEYLASPEIRLRCQMCSVPDQIHTSCPLLQLPGEQNSIYCLPVRYGAHEFGILNMYMRDTNPIDQPQRTFLSVLVEVTALAIDNFLLKQRELTTLQQLQSARQKADINSMIKSLLDSVIDTLEVDFTIFTPYPTNILSAITISYSGIVPKQSNLFIEGVVQSVFTSGAPYSVGDVSSSPEIDPGLRTLTCVPVYGSENRIFGVLTIGRNKQQMFSQRESSLLQVIAGQIAFLIENTTRVNEVEYRVMIEERKRLAREIHDGLAQTIGFLKLQTAQIRNYIGRGEYTRVRNALDTYYETLSEAYQEARQAIDGLRIGLDAGDLGKWIEEMTHEFEDVSGYPVQLRRMDFPMDIPLEVQAQMIRIFQEALSNIRKHANANQIWVDCYILDGDFHIDVQDNGMGFDPEDVTETSRHGLKGMRERSDLIGADFQIVSRLGEGTIIKIRLPLKYVQGEEKFAK